MDLVDTPHDEEDPVFLGALLPTAGRESRDGIETGPRGEDRGEDKHKGEWRIQDPVINIAF